jgi:hypothetical protein
MDLSNAIERLLNVLPVNTKPSPSKPRMSVQSQFQVLLGGKSAALAPHG